MIKLQHPSRTCTCDIRYVRLCKFISILDISNNPESEREYPENLTRKRNSGNFSRFMLNYYFNEEK